MKQYTVTAPLVVVRDPSGGSLTYVYQGAPLPAIDEAQLDRLLLFGMVAEVEEVEEEVEPTAPVVTPTDAPEKKALTDMSYVELQELAKEKGIPESAAKDELLAALSA